MPIANSNALTFGVGDMGDVAGFHRHHAGLDGDQNQ
jgi:hypothetical protein